MGVSNAGGVGKNRDSEPKSGCISYAVKRSSGKCSKLSCDEPCRVYNNSRWWAAEFVDGILAGNNNELYDKKPQRCTEDNVTQWLIWNLSNNNKRLRTIYFVEANYWRTQSFARLLCNSRTTCFFVNEWKSLLTCTKNVEIKLYKILNSVASVVPS